MKRIFLIFMALLFIGIKVSAQEAITVDNNNYSTDKVLITDKTFDQIKQDVATDQASIDKLDSQIQDLSAQRDDLNSQIDVLQKQKSNINSNLSFIKGVTAIVAPGNKQNINWTIDDVKSGSDMVITP